MEIVIRENVFYKLLIAQDFLTNVIEANRTQTDLPVRKNIKISTANNIVVAITIWHC